MTTETFPPDPNEDLPDEEPEAATAPPEEPDTETEEEGQEESPEDVEG